MNTTMQLLPRDFGRQFDLYMTKYDCGHYLSATVREGGKIVWDRQVQKENVKPVLSLDLSQLTLLREALDSLGKAVND